MVSLDFERKITKCFKHDILQLLADSQSCIENIRVFGVSANPLILPVAFYTPCVPQTFAML